MNTFGDNLEPDPCEKGQLLRKRKALGRMGHANAAFTWGPAGQPVVACAGEDARSENIHKGVSTAPWHPADGDAPNCKALSDQHLGRGKLLVTRRNRRARGQRRP